MWETGPKTFHPSQNSKFLTCPRLFLMLFPTCLPTLFLTVTPSFFFNSTLVNATVKISRGPGGEGNGSETATMEEAFLLAVKAVNPELSEQEIESIEAFLCANCSLKIFSHLIDIRNCCVFTLSPQTAAGRKELNPRKMVITDHSPIKFS